MPVAGQSIDHWLANWLSNRKVNLQAVTLPLAYTNAPT